jgi:predicted dehydrogenase
MKIVLIGCGSIGGQHARTVMSSGRHTLALCDSYVSLAEKLGELHGISEIYSDYHEAIRTSGAQAAIVCTPNHLHAAPTIAALNAGLHVLCEKPAADSAASAKAMSDASDAAGRVLYIGFPLRVAKPVSKIREILDSGRLGRLSSARVILAAPETLTCAKTPYRKSYETGGGIIYDYSHEIDYCRYFFGNPDKVVAFVDLMFPDLDTCDDNAAMILHYNSGFCITLHYDYVQQKGASRGRSIAIVCEKGFIETNFSTMLTVFNNNGDTENYSYSYLRDNDFADQLARFEQAVAGREVSYATGRDGYEVLRVIDELYRSARTETIITL